MKNLIFTLSLLLLTGFSAFAQDKKTEVETLLQIETGDGKTVALKLADFAKLPRREVRAKTHDGKEAVFSGVEVREILQFAGVKFGKEAKGANLTSYLIVEAADNYRVIFAMTDFDSEFTDKVIILADLREGKPLSKEEGKIRIVVPDEKKQGRWVRQVIALKVKKAEK